MRRSAAAAATAIAVAGIVASVALAKGGVVVKVPAPAVGQTSAALVTVTVTGPARGAPKFSATNLAALGKGFGGAVIGAKGKTVGKSTTYKAFFVFFMGNLSTSPASTVDVQVTPPPGDTVTASKPKDETKNCSTLKGLNPLISAYASAAFLGELDHSGSKPQGFLQSTLSFMCH